MHSSDDNRLRGVSCTACNCAFHCENDQCCAPSILVGSDAAETKRETNCNTFHLGSM